MTQTINKLTILVLPFLLFQIFSTQVLAANSNNTYQGQTYYFGDGIELANGKWVKYTSAAGITIQHQCQGNADQNCRPKINYLYPDQVSSTTLVTDQQGNKVQELAYYPYGKEFKSQTSKPNNPTDHLYTSQVKDQTKLYFYNARYYNPQTASFISADYAKDPTNRGNRYLYVGGNPVSRNDPGGTRFIQQAGGGEGGGWRDPFTNPKPQDTEKLKGDLLKVAGIGLAVPAVMIGGTVGIPAAMTYLAQAGVAVDAASSVGQLYNGDYRGAAISATLGLAGPGINLAGLGFIKRARSLGYLTEAGEIAIKGGQVIAKDAAYMDQVEEAAQAAKVAMTGGQSASQAVGKEARNMIRLAHSIEEGRDAMYSARNMSEAALHANCWVASCVAVDIAQAAGISANIDRLSLHAYSTIQGKVLDVASMPFGAESVPEKTIKFMLMKSTGVWAGVVGYESAFGSKR